MHSSRVCTDSWLTVSRGGGRGSVPSMQTPLPPKADPLSPVNRQTHVKTLPSPILRMLSVISFKINKHMYSRAYDMLWHCIRRHQSAASFTELITERKLLHLILKTSRYLCCLIHLNRARIYPRCHRMS